MERNIYSVENPEEIQTPGLLYFNGIIEENTRKTIEMAGSLELLWPHVKSHKTEELIHMQMNYGIRRFKASTFAEVVMLMKGKAESVLWAYPLVGPNIKKAIQVCKQFPETQLIVLGDHIDSIHKLSLECLSNNVKMGVLVDINPGLDRTGIHPDELSGFYDEISREQGIEILGIHCYDGNIHDSDPHRRRNSVNRYRRILDNQISRLEDAGVSLPIRVMGGSPTMPCHILYGNCQVSPGTTFLWDAGYSKQFPDLDFISGAAVATRVISRPGEGIFTLDLGCKGIASDPVGKREILLDQPYAEPVFQNEEHWVFKMKAGHETETPETGTMLYVIPTHICPTSALYNRIYLIQNGKVEKTIRVSARNRIVEEE